MPDDFLQDDSDNSADGENRAPSIPYEDLVTIAKVLVRDYADEQGWTTADLQRLDVAQFAQWTTDSGAFRARREEFAERLDVDDKVLDAVEEHLSDNYRASRMLLPIWPLLVHVEPPIKARPVFSQIALTIGFDDGQLLQCQAPCTWDGGPATTGLVLTTLSAHFSQVMATLAQEGLEKAIKNHAVHSPKLVAQLASEIEKSVGKTSK